MTRVATFAMQQLSLSHTKAAQSRNQDLRIQTSSGKASRDYAGIAADSRRLLGFEAIRAQALRFSSNIDTVDRRLKSMEAATSQIFDLATAYRSKLLTATSANNAENLVLQKQTRDLLDQVAGLLNADQDGRFLFAGGLTDTKPVDLDAILKPRTQFVDSVEFNGAATTSGTGISGLTGLVSVRAPSGSSGDALRVTYNGAGTLTVTNLKDGASADATIAAPPPAGETKDYSVTVNGLEVVVTIDSQFNLATPITTQPITGTVGGGAGAFGAISLINTQGDISRINGNSIDVSSPTADAANVTLTLPSANGDFVATGLDFETATGLQDIKLINATTGAQLTLRVDIGTALADAAVNDPGTEINLDNVLVNLAATNGATAPAAALPGQPGYDPTDPTYYQGDLNKPSLRADEQVTVKYGVTAADAGFEKLVRALYIAHQASTPGAINSDDLDKALGLVAEAIEEIPNIRSEIGSSRAVLESTKKLQNNTTLLAEKTITDVENTDITEALTLLAQNSTLIEASFATLSRFNNISLLKYI